VAVGVQHFAQGRNHVGQPAGLGQRRHFRGQQGDGEGVGHLRRSWCSYDAAMRGFLLGLTLTLLLLVSVGVGIVVARWPLYPHLWP